MIDDPCRDRMQHDAVHPEDLAHMLQMLLVAAQPVDILDNDDIRQTGDDHCEKLLETGALHRRAGDAVIAAPGHELEPVALGIPPREGLLVGDRCGAVIRVIEALAAIADRTLGHVVSEGTT